MPLNDVEIQLLEQRKIQALKECKICKGIGEIPVVENGLISYLQECECMKQIKWELSMIDAGIPELYFDADLSSYQGKKQPSFAKVQSYCDKIKKAREKGIGLFLQGSLDSGKSYLSICVLKEALKKGYTGYYTSLFQIIEKIKASFSDGKSKSVNTEMLYWRDVLVIEDINRVYKANSEYVDSTFADILHQRNLYNRITIITLRGVMQDIQSENKYGSELYSVFQAKLIPIALTETGYRKKYDAYKTLMEEA